VENYVRAVGSSGISSAQDPEAALISSSRRKLAQIEETVRGMSIWGIAHSYRRRSPPGPSSEPSFWVLHTVKHGYEWKGECEEGGGWEKRSGQHSSFR